MQNTFFHMQDRNNGSIDFLNYNLYFNLRTREMAAAVTHSLPSLVAAAVVPSATSLGSTAASRGRERYRIIY